MLTPPPPIFFVVVVLSMVSLFVVGKFLKGTFICTCMNIIIFSDSGGTLYSKRLCCPGKDCESGRLVNALAKDAVEEIKQKGFCSHTGISNQNTIWEPDTWEERVS